MSNRTRLAAVLAAALGLAAGLWLFSRQAVDPTQPTASKGDHPSAAAADPSTDPLPSLKGLPTAATPTADGGPAVPAAGAATPGDAAAAAVAELALPPTPADEAGLRAELADPNRPVAFSYARFLVDRYLAKFPKGGPLPPDAAVDELFPVEFQARLGLPPGARLVAIDGRPIGLPGALDEAFRPGTGATWRLKLEFSSGEAAPVSRDLVLRH